MFIHIVLTGYYCCVQINIRDNGLSDAVMAKFILAVSPLATLSELDLSQNNIAPVGVFVTTYTLVLRACPRWSVGSIVRAVLHPCVP